MLLSVISASMDYSHQTTNGVMTPAKKPTKWATSSAHMAARLSKICSGGHRHQPLPSGRAEHAAFYPLPLVTEILRGMRGTADNEDPIVEPNSPEISSAVFKAAHVRDVPVSDCSVDNSRGSSRGSMHTKLKMHDGTVNDIDLSQHFRDSYKDECTNELLPKEWIQDAIFEELQYFNQHVWIGVPEGVAKQDADATAIGTRWVPSNKGDIHQPDVRARLVAQEVGDGPDSAFYAATPPSRPSACSFRSMPQSDVDRARISRYP